MQVVAKQISRCQYIFQLTHTRRQYLICNQHTYLSERIVTDVIRSEVELNISYLCMSYCSGAIIAQVRNVFRADIKIYKNCADISMNCSTVI